MQKIIIKSLTAFLFISIIWTASAHFLFNHLIDFKTLGSNPLELALSVLAIGTLLIIYFLFCFQIIENTKSEIKELRKAEEEESRKAHKKWIKFIKQCEEDRLIHAFEKEAERQALYEKWKKGQELLKQLNS